MWIKGGVQRVTNSLTKGLIDAPGDETGGLERGLVTEHDTVMVVL